MRGQHLAHSHILRFRRVDDTIGHELAQCRLIGVLELAAAACGNVSARRDDMMRSRRQRAIRANRIAGHAARNMPAGRRDAIAARGNSLNDLGFAHRNAAMAGLTARARSPAEKAGDANRAAS